MSKGIHLICKADNGFLFLGSDTAQYIYPEQYASAYLFDNAPECIKKRFETEFLSARVMARAIIRNAKRKGIIPAYITVSGGYDSETYWYADYAGEIEDALTYGDYDDRYEVA